MSVYISNPKLWTDFYRQNTKTKTQTGRGRIRGKNRSMTTIYHDIPTITATGMTPANMVSPVQQFNQQATS